MHDLLSTKNKWVKIEKELSSAPVLATYNANKETADPLSLYAYVQTTQKSEQPTWIAIAYVSRSLTLTEQKFTQIEKEAMGMWNVQ